MRRLTGLLATGALLLAACTTEPAATDGGSPDAPRATSGEPSSPGPTSSKPDPLAALSQRTLDGRLRDAAWANDVPRARRLIVAGADVNAKDSTRQSAYLIATSEGYLRLLELTLANGANVGSLDSFDGTGLIRAAERGHHDIVGRLVQTPITVDHVNNLGWVALHEAIVLGDGSPRYVDTVRVLVAAGADLEIRAQRDGSTPLQLAASAGYSSIVTTLEAGLSENIAQRDADQALLRAAADGDADGVAVSLRAGADIEARDGQRRTALLIATTEDHVEVARLLVDLGANPDALDDRHDTPWLVTGVTGSVAMLETLLPAHPDLTIRNRYGGISVIPASERGHVDYVRRVVQTDVDVNHVNDLGWTALLEAVILGDGGERHQQIVRILLDAGADASIADNDGVTALQHAERQGFDQIARQLRAASG
ncbi:MAG: ankyrin repeat domain-containing protein [Actinomycetes bacterium]